MNKSIVLAAVSALGLATAAYAQGHQHQPGAMSNGMHQERSQNMPHMSGMDHMGMKDQAATQETYAAVGTVVSINDVGGMPSVTINHEPVQELKWPAMTMAFQAASPDLLKNVRTGDKVAFHFKKGDKGSWIITQVKKTGN